MAFACKADRALVDGIVMGAPKLNQYLINPKFILAHQSYHLVHETQPGNKSMGVNFRNHDLNIVDKNLRSRKNLQLQSLNIDFPSVSSRSRLSAATWRRLVPPQANGEIEGSVEIEISSLRHFLAHPSAM